MSHEELSEMVGTTRPRISLFMERFKHLGLIERGAERFLIIKEKNSPITWPRSPRAAGRFRRSPTIILFKMVQYWTAILLQSAYR
ncbi:MAG: helix-turn-helix domain-containing protein [Candidatus Binatia bacterium]|nr:helix-turn-helix domain-containing protein [Candidatus Binatia bacterium]